MKLLIECGRLSEGSIVTKPNGDKEYLLKNSVKVYGLPEQQKEIKGEGVRFLVSSSGDANAIPLTAIVAWVCNVDQLHNWVMEQLAEIPK